MTPNKNKIRIDELLVLRGFASDIVEAKGLIMSGSVLYCDKPITKTGTTIPIDAALRIRHSKEHHWVSRGAIKLEHAIVKYGINPSGMLAIDIGSSTGGFTEVLLHYGAGCVYAVDVGYGELAWKLRNDDRVVVLERTNARYLTEKQIPVRPDIIVCDASFISLKTILPASLNLAKEGTLLVALIKPQFEVNQNEVGDNGIVRDQALHMRVCDDISTWLAAQPGWSVTGVIESPIKGREGNTEFLIYGKFTCKNLNQE